MTILMMTLMRISMNPRQRIHFEDELESEIDEEPVLDKSECDRFTDKDAFILGGAMGLVYEMGLEEWRR